MSGLYPLKFSTKENYRTAIHRFEQFCFNHYSGRNLDLVLRELESIPSQYRDEAYFGILQDFVNWMIDLGLSNTTINQYFQIMVFYFSYHGIRAHPIDLRQNVRRPRKIKEKLHPLTRDEIRQIFRFSPEKRKMLYLVLVGTGMRIQECVALRKVDFDPGFSKRIKIEIPAKCTKSQTAHTTFISREASRFLKPYLESIQSQDLVFATNLNPFHAKMTEIEAFSRYRKRAGLNNTYESTNRHHITLHSFRSYFFTRARRVHDTEIAHAMVGHTTYLDMYDRKTDEERLQLYLEVEPQLKILSNKAQII